MTTNPMLPITIVARKPSDGVVTAKHKLLDLLNDLNVPFQIDNHDNTLAGLDQAMLPKLVRLESVKNGLLVSIGGDGSLLRLIPHAAANDLPIIGVNLGRLGFLADLPADDLSMLAEVIDGHCIKSPRALLAVSHTDGERVKPLGIGLNELCIKSERPGKALVFSITTHNNCFHYRADGYIIATPTGSTAYALSSGGPVISPDVDAQLMLPICPHGQHTHPIVLPADSITTLQIAPDHTDKAIIFVDGSVVGTLRAGQKLQVSKSQQSVTLIHPKEYNFMSVCRDKLHWKPR